MHEEYYKPVFVFAVVDKEGGSSRYCRLLLHKLDSGSRAVHSSPGHLIPKTLKSLRCLGQVAQHLKGYRIVTSEREPSRVAIEAVML
jgi:hypothetical protein